MVSGLSASPVRDDALTLHFIGNLLTFRARGTETGGRFSLIDALTAPGHGSPPHTQTDEEAFLVLDGTYEFLIGDSLCRRATGDFVYVPPGTPHAFRNVGDAPGRMIILNLPAGLHEGFFQAVGEPVTLDGGFPPPAPPDVEGIDAAATRFGIAFVPMPAPHAG